MRRSAAAKAARRSSRAGIWRATFSCSRDRRQHGMRKGAGLKAVWAAVRAPPAQIGSKGSAADQRTFARGMRARQRRDVAAARRAGRVCARTRRPRHHAEVLERHAEGEVRHARPSQRAAREERIAASWRPQRCSATASASELVVARGIRRQALQAFDRAGGGRGRAARETRGCRRWPERGSPWRSARTTKRLAG